MSDDASPATDDAAPEESPDVDEPPRADQSMETATDRPSVSAIERQRPAYTESQVIMTTVKAVAPFAFTYGLFVTFHGAGAPGGGFQGGAIMAAVILMIAFAFGIESTRDWLSNVVVVGLAVGGVLIFAGTGLATMALGGAFLDYALLPIPDPVKWGMELVEIGGIAPIVASVLVGLFFLLAAGFPPLAEELGASAAGDSAGEEGPSDGGRVDDGATDGGRAGDDGATDGGRAGDDGATDGGRAGDDGITGDAHSTDDAEVIEE